MEQAIAKALDWLIEQGAGGIVIFFLLIVIWYINKEWRACDKIGRENEARFAKALEESTSAIRGQTVALTTTNQVMEARTQAIQKISEELREARHEGQLARQEILNVVQIALSQRGST